MDLEKLLREAYAIGVAEAQIAEQIPNMSFDFDGMATAYAQSKVKNLGLFNVSQQRELLLAFADFLREEKGTEFISTPWVDKFLKANNCG